jgi:hypothetical protein
MDQNSTAAGGHDTVMKRSGKAKENYTCIQPINVQYLLLTLVYPDYLSVIRRKKCHNQVLCVRWLKKSRIDKNSRYKQFQNRKNGV